jgi:hypothetical protein
LIGIQSEGNAASTHPTAARESVVLEWNPSYSHNGTITPLYTSTKTATYKMQANTMLAWERRKPPIQELFSCTTTSS